MRTLATWGSQHPVPTRWIIFLSFIALNVLAINLAWWAMVHGLIAFEVLLPLSIGLGLVGLFLYPLRRWKGSIFSKSGYFRYQKTMDGLLVGATFLMVFSMTQQFSVQSLAPAPYRAVATALDYEPVREKGFLKKLKDFKNEVVEKVKAQVVKRLDAYSKAKEGLPVWAKILLSLGALVVAFFVWYIIAALGCSLVCSGAELAGNIVIIAGTALILAMLVWVGYQIWKRRGPKVEKVPKEERVPKEKKKG
ncbi:MAG: hypothetical protein IPG32_01685 [Saprospirales bacterium]|nr:hypothetical protein [Saprospirales bacterium]